MLYDVDTTGRRCERCHVLIGMGAVNFVTAMRTPASSRGLHNPGRYILARQCRSCMAGRCASVLGPYHAQTGKRCPNKRQRGLGACESCDKIIRNSAARFGITQEGE